MAILQHPHHRFVPGVEAPDRREAERHVMASVAGATWANCNLVVSTKAPTVPPRPRGLDSTWHDTVNASHAAGACAARARLCAAACRSYETLAAIPCGQRCESERMTCAMETANRATGQPPTHPSLLTPSPLLGSGAATRAEQARRALEAAVNGR